MAKSVAKRMEWLTLWAQTPQVDRGGPPGIRTPNLRIKSPLLCQVELEARRSLPTASRRPVADRWVPPHERRA